MIVDASVNVTARLPALKAAGVTDIGRYGSVYGGAKVVTAAEAHAIANSGMKLFLIYEDYGRPSGAAIGARDGAYMARFAPSVGASAGACMMYTVDWDAGPADMPGIIAAFQAFRAQVSPTFKVGAYASGAVCAALFSAGLIEVRWLTCSGGFRGTQTALATGAYELRQSLPRDVAGVNVDPNTTHFANGEFGSFVPFSGAVAPVPAPIVGPPLLGPGSSGDDVKKLQTALNAHPTPLPVTGVFDATTEAYVQNFQRANGLTPDGWVGAQTWPKLLA